MFAVFLHGKAIYSVSLATCLCLDCGSHDAGDMMSMAMGSKWFAKAHVIAVCVETITMKTNAQ